MEYKKKLDDLLERVLEKKYLKLWKTLDSVLPQCMHLPVSSTGKYHKTKDGRIPTISEHTYNMVAAASKIIRMFGCQIKSDRASAILLAIALHDRVKYGHVEPLREHTDNAHDQNMANILEKNKERIQKILGEENYQILEEGIRFHSGRWSTDIRNNGSEFFNKRPETIFIHVLDMLDTSNLLCVE